MTVPYRIRLTAILVAPVLVFGTAHVVASPQGIAGDSSSGEIGRAHV